MLQAHDPRGDGRDRLEDVVVVAVDVDAEEVDLAGEAMLLEQGVDVGGGHEGLAEGEPAACERLPVEGADAVRVVRVPLHPEAPPALFEEVARVVLEASLAAELDETPVRGPDDLEDPFNDPVLVGLAVDLEARPFEPCPVAAGPRQAVAFQFIGRKGRLGGRHGAS